MTAWAVIGKGNRNIEPDISAQFDDWSLVKVTGGSKMERCTMAVGPLVEILLMLPVSRDEG